MAKKLMMNNYSENGLMPVMDGLVCWFDARDGENGVTQIKDRTQYNNILTLDNFTWDFSNKFDKGVLKITKEQTVRSLIDSSTFDINNCTIEYNGRVYWSSPTSHDEHIFTLNPSIQYTFPNIYGFASNNNRIHVMTGRNLIVNYNLQEMTGDVFNLFIAKSNDNVGYCIGNGQTFQVSTATINDNGSEIHDLCFGLNGQYINETKFKVVQDFHSIRIYNRVLSDEERNQNYLYEQSINRGE